MVNKDLHNKKQDFRHMKNSMSNISTCTHELKWCLLSEVTKTKTKPNRNPNRRIFLKFLELIGKERKKVQIVIAHTVLPSRFFLVSKRAEKMVNHSVK